jgi:phosphate transport system substrate-binding protein
MRSIKAKEMNRGFSKYSFLFLAVVLFSCADKKSSLPEHYSTRYDGYRGQFTVACDAGLEPIIRQQKEVFEFIYDSVQLNIRYEAEKEMFDDFRSKKATVMLLAHPLTEAEINNLKTRDTIYIKELPVAYDAVALIGNPAFDDSKLDTDLLKKYFSPQSSLASAPRLVFDNQHSSLVRFVLDYLGYKEKLSPNVFALQSGKEVIDYVAENKNAIGLIPFNLISDTDDERIKEVRKRIKILSLRAKTKDGEIIRVSANQSDILTGDYPLIRTVDVVTRFTHEDNLESLFMSFLTREKGSKIFLKAGLIPIKMQERDIIVNEGELTGGK